MSAFGHVSLWRRRRISERAKKNRFEVLLSRPKNHEMERKTMNSRVQLSKTLLPWKVIRFQFLLTICLIFSFGVGVGNRQNFWRKCIKANFGFYRAHLLQKLIGFDGNFIPSKRVENFRRNCLETISPILVNHAFHAFVKQENFFFIFPWIHNYSRRTDEVAAIIRGSDRHSSWCSSRILKTSK